MKTLLSIAAVVALLGGVGAVRAQDFVAPLPKPQKVAPVTPLTPKPTIEGIVAEIFTTKKPWQLVNPAAPKKYGTGEKNVSKDFGPGTPYKSSGWIIAGVAW